MKIERDNAFTDPTYDKELYKWEEMMVVVVVMVTVVEIDPKEIQITYFYLATQK